MVRFKACKNCGFKNLGARERCQRCDSKLMSISEWNELTGIYTQWGCEECRSVQGFWARCDCGKTMQQSIEKHGINNS